MEKLNKAELEQVAGGNYGFDAYRAWEALVIRVNNAAYSHNKKPCCPACGAKLEWLPQSKSDDFVNRCAYEKGLLKCMSCKAENKTDKWVSNSFN